jgi:hypothetical protein
MGNYKGMTLVELLVVSFVFIAVIGPLLASIVSLLYLLDITKCQSIAIVDLCSIMEKIKSTPFNNMQTSFPDGVVNGPGGNSYPALIGSYTLQNEQIAVTYPDINADPLEIQATAMWQDKNGRPYSTSISTFKTR